MLIYNMCTFSLPSFSYTNSEIGKMGGKYRSSDDLGFIVAQQVRQQLGLVGDAR
jgi:hypothetical protein